MSDVEMSDLELGRAVLVYEGPNGGRGTIETDNEHVVYFHDHWLVMMGGDSDGNDVVRRIPRDRVQYVERSVEGFHDRTDTMLNHAWDRFD